MNSIDRSRRIYEAMLLRGFNNSFHTVTELHAARVDYVFSFFFFFILTGLLVADIYLRFHDVW